MNDDVIPGEPQAPPTVPRRLPRLPLRTKLPALLVLAAVLGSAAYAGYVAHHANRTVRTVVWKKPPDPGEAGAAGAPDPASGIGTGRKDSPLSKDLLPVVYGILGPELPSLGNDALLNSRESEAYLRHLSAALSGPDAGGQSGSDGGAHVEEMAVRTYNDLYGTITQIRITRLSDANAARKAYAAGVLAGDTGDKNVPVPRYPKGAKCFSASDAESGAEWEGTDDGSGLVQVSCAAYRDDLEISLQSYGTSDMDPSDVSTLFAQQLDRIESTGKSV
ncbi:hypothetical protein [Streptomyces sp. NBC_01497]|uniref:hypothetical protein n=1 Tax=Streptomyces sp. NBC_01497 TaxID=2903885 RepID=UPI002E3033F0|nr:hypothetical protein [Streptomyces sp. NBC_01497]